MGIFRQIVQGQVFFEMVVNEAADKGGFFAGFSGRRNEGYGKFAAAHQMQKQDFQKILAGRVVAWRFCLNFLEKVFKEKEKGFPFGLEMDDRISVFSVVAGQGFNSVNADHDIFQRIFFRADLRMLYIGIYNNHIIRGNGNIAVKEPQKTLASRDEKNFRTWMGVQGAVPFRTVAGHTDVQKFGDRAVHRIN